LKRCSRSSLRQLFRCPPPALVPTQESVESFVFNFASRPAQLYRALTFDLLGIPQDYLFRSALPDCCNAESCNSLQLRSECETHPWLACGLGHWPNWQLAGLAAGSMVRGAQTRSHVLELLPLAYSLR